MERKKKKILHTITWLAPGGGVDNNIFLTIRELFQEFEFHLASGAEIYHNPFTQIEGLSVFICRDLVRPIHLIKDFKALLYFIRLIRREKYDIVHTHETKASLITRLAAYFAGCRGIIYGLHGVTFNDPMPCWRRSIYRWIERHTVWMVKRIISVSEDSIREYHEARIGLNIPYDVIYSGIDIREFTDPAFSHKELMALKESLSIKVDETVIINIGRFSKAKAQIDTIEALGLVMKDVATVKCIFVGEGEELEVCRKRAADLGLEDRIIFYGFSDNIPLFLHVSDIHVITSRREGLPRVVVEAALCKVPTAGFEVEGIREIIRDHESGFIVSQGDVADLARCIVRLIQEPRLRKNFGERVFEHARRDWDHHIMVEKLREIYRETG